MPVNGSGQIAVSQHVDRREFLRRAGWGGAGMTALLVSARRGRAAAATSPYPDWIPASTKLPKRGGTLTRASAWDPPVIDPRLTQSVGLFQFVGLTSSRLIRYAFPDEASSTNDLTLKGDLAESWSSSPDSRMWTFKIRQGVKWQNVPPLNGRELTAADVKYCYEGYAKEGVQSFTFREIEGMETPDKYTLRVHLRTPNALFPQNVAESVTVIFPREVLEEDGDLKKRLIGPGPYILKEHTRTVRVVLARNPEYYDKGRPYVDEYVILSTPDAAHSKSTKNFFRVNDPVIDELTLKLRQTPDRAEQRVIAKKIVDRELDQVLRMWMPYDNGFLVFQPYVRNGAALAIRRTDAYGSPTIARLWLDK